jgi:hypothetical protein
MFFGRLGPTRDLMMREDDAIKTETVTVKQAQKENQSARRTHWAAQFAVASELCKRGYEVALTMANHPVFDLMVVSPKGVPFLIDVIGQYKKNVWPVRLKTTRGKLFYVLVFVPHAGQNRFFILRQEAAKKANTA